MVKKSVEFSTVFDDKLGNSAADPPVLVVAVAPLSSLSLFLYFQTAQREKGAT